MKKPLFLMLLSLLLLCSAAFADTVTIGTGTATTSYFPLYGLYGYNYTQQIFTQAQINHAGNITKIRFFYVSGSIATSKDWVIYMGHTNKTAFDSTTDWIPLASLNQVYAGDVTSYLPAANNWMEIPLTTPFPYNNTQNLVIAVDENTPSYSSMSWGGFTSGTNTGIYYYSDSINPDPASPPTASSRSGTINRIQLAFPNSSAPLAPTLVNPANNAWFLAGDRLTWTTTPGGGDANTYDVYFGTAANPPLVSADQTASSYLPTVSPATTYYWKVVAKNEIGDSPASETRSFKVPGAENLVESFESTTFPPTGWANPGTWSRSTTYFKHGTASVYKAGSASAQYIISTPKLMIMEDDTFSFWAYCTAATGILQVVYSTDRVTWTQLGANITYPAASTWYNYSINVSSLAGNDYYLGLRTGLATGSHYVDLVIGPQFARELPNPPTLGTPANNANYVSLTPTFSWTAAATGGIPTSYKVYCDTNPNPSTLVGTATGTTFTLTTPLAPGTNYYWTVKASNSAGDSAPATPNMFTTVPEGIVAIGDGVSNQYMPVNTLYGYSYAQSIYKQNEINVANQRIEKIAYYWNGLADGSASNLWTVYMGHTDLTDFATTTSWIPLSQLIQVYTGTLNIPATPGWIEVVLTNPFAYNNTQNLVIAVDENQPNYLSTGFFFNTLYTNQYYSLRCQSDTANPDPVAPPVGTRTAARPNILMQFGDLPSNPIFSYAPASIDFGQVVHAIQTGPQNVIVSNTGGGTINLSAAAISLIGTNASQFSFGTANLPAALGPGQSVTIPVYVTATSEGPISATLRIVYNAANYDVALSASGLPAGTVFIGTGTLTQRQPFGIYFGYERSAALYTATQVGLQGILDRVGWYCATTSVNAAPYKIYAGTTTATALTAQTWDAFKAPLTLVKEGSQIFETADWYSFDLNTPIALSGENLIIAVETFYGGGGISTYPYFRYSTGATGSHMYWNADTNPPTTTGTLNTQLPNVMLHVIEPIEGIPAAPIMTNPAHNATGLPATGFNLNWSPDLENGGAPDYYAVYMSQDEDTIFDDHYFETDNTYFNPVTEGYMDLGYEETWYWLVQAFNSYGDALADRPFSFVTETDPRIISLPHSQNFDGVPTPTFPRAWTAVKTNTSSSLTTSSTYNHTPSNSVYMYNSGTAETLRLVTPQITVPINSIRFSFQMRATSVANYSLKVGTVSSPDASGVFTLVQTITPTVAAAFTPVSVSFAGYTGTDRYICIQHGLGASAQSFYLDTFLFEELMPVDLAAPALTGPSFGTAGTPFTFNLSVNNNGTAVVNAYDIMLKDQGGNTLVSHHISEPLAPADTEIHELVWTPALGGNYQVHGEVVAAGDGNATNNTTTVRHVLVFDNSMTQIPVGNDASADSGYYLPYSFYYKNSIGESLYFPDELHLNAGTINSVIFKNTFTRTDVLNKPVKIWMAHTNVSDLTGGWLPAENYSLVFDGNVDFPAGVNYIVIPLTTPFNYNGGILAMRFSRPMDTQYYSTTDKFYYTTTPAHTNRGRYMISDSVTYDPMNPAVGGVGTPVGYVANTTFIVQNAMLQEHVRLEGHVRDASNNPIAGATVTLTDERYSTTTDGSGYYSFIFWEAHNVSINVSKAGYYPQSMAAVALVPGHSVTQDFVLTALPRVSVSGVVKGNDNLPIEGAQISLNGGENYQVFSSATGTFSIANVLGHSSGTPYTLTITKSGHTGYSASVTVYAANLDLGNIILVEMLWPATDLVAVHSGTNVNLTWEEATEPSYFFWDFEADNGGWVSGGYGDWEWGNTYPAGGTFNWIEYATSCVPPPAAHSGTGLWGTKLYTNYSNSGAWSYLTKTVNLAGIENPQLRFWRWNNMNGDYDYYQVQVNGTMVFEEKVLANNWAEKVVNLSAYANQEITIRFAAMASTVVAYAGVYIDDVYIGPPPSPGSRIAQNRSLQGYNVYRMLAADQTNPANWTLLHSGFSGLSYTDNTFSTAPGGKYKWAVRATYDGNHLAPAVISNQLGRVYAPQDISVVQTGTNVNLTWTPEPGANFYKIYGADAPDGTYQYLGNSATTSYPTSAGAGKKFFKVTAVADEAPPRSPGISK